MFMHPYKYLSGTLIDKYALCPDESLCADMYVCFIYYWYD